MDIRELKTECRQSFLTLRRSSRDAAHAGEQIRLRNLNFTKRTINIDSEGQHLNKTLHRSLQPRSKTFASPIYHLLAINVPYNKHRANSPAV
jgi:hypothetical protein